MSNAAIKIDFVDKKTKQEFHYPIDIFRKPSNDKEYGKLEKVLDELIDAIRDNEKHPLVVAMQIIGENLERYDSEHFPDIGSNVSDIDMVKFLMKSHHLRQEDLADIFGDQANVSKFLNGERLLSKNQIIGLKKRFGISADFFVK